MQIIGHKALGHSKWPDLELSGGKIVLTIKSIFQPLADRDVMIQSDKEALMSRTNALKSF